MDFLRRKTIYTALGEFCKSFRGKGSHLVFPVAGASFSLDVLSLQNPKPAQRPRIAISKTSKAVRTKKVVSAPMGKEKPIDGAGISKD